MFERIDVVDDVPADLTELFAETWSHLAAPGTAWSGEQRIAIADVARTARRGDAAGEGVRSLPAPAIEAASLIAARPARADEPWVRSIVEALDETKYVELVGVVAMVSCVDTITQMLGAGVEPLPEPQHGLPTGAPFNRALRRRSAWVAMTGPPLPRHALTAAPDTQAAANRLLDRLYMTADELREVGPVRGLRRTQMELVIVALSHSNECFY